MSTITLSRSNRNASRAAKLRQSHRNLRRLMNRHAKLSNTAQRLHLGILPIVAAETTKTKETENAERWYLRIEHCDTFPFFSPIITKASEGAAYTRLGNGPWLKNVPSCEPKRNGGLYHTFPVGDCFVDDGNFVSASDDNGLLFASYGRCQVDLNGEDETQVALSNPRFRIERERPIVENCNDMVAAECISPLGFEGTKDDDDEYVWEAFCGSSAFAELWATILRVVYRKTTTSWAFRDKNGNVRHYPARSVSVNGWNGAEDIAQDAIMRLLGSDFSTLPNGDKLSRWDYRRVVGAVKMSLLAALHTRTKAAGSDVLQWAAERNHVSHLKDFMAVDKEGAFSIYCAWSDWQIIRNDGGKVVRLIPNFVDACELKDKMNDGKDTYGVRQLVNQDDRKVVRLLATGRTVTETAKALGIERSKVTVSVRRIKGRLANLYSDHVSGSKTVEGLIVSELDSLIESMKLVPISLRKLSVPQRIARRLAEASAEVAERLAELAAE